MISDTRGDDGLERLVVDEQRQSDDIQVQHPNALSKPLQMLFALNGMALSLPSTALLYIVNSRASVPLSYLSAYGAIAFLPFSLKPVYACLSACLGQRSRLLFVLLGLNGLATAGTVLVPPHGVLECFILAFIRGVTNAWPEFLLGLTLIGEAQRCHEPFESTAAFFQSQAATARNMGSILANFVAVSIFIHGHLGQTTDDNQELSDTVVNTLLIFTGITTCAGAVVAWFFRVGGTRSIISGYARLSNKNDDEVQSSSSSWTDMVLILQLQVLIALFTARDLLEDVAASWIWRTVTFTCVVSLVMLFCLSYGNWSRRRRVGLFLIAKHAVPTSTYIMQSYVYELFRSSPLAIQLLGLVSMGTTTLSSWSYGKLLSKHSSGWNFIFVLAGTITFAAICSVTNTFLVGLDTTTASSLWKAFAVVATIRVVTTFADEWRFLPSVVLATVSVSASSIAPDDCRGATGDVFGQSHLEHSNHDIEDASGTDASYQESAPRASCAASTDMQYGALVSCIDFGGQIGSWLTIPLVSALGMSRDNGWQHLDSFVFATASLALLPILLVGLLMNRHPP